MVSHEDPARNARKRVSKACQGCRLKKSKAWASHNHYVSIEYMADNALSAVEALHANAAKPQKPFVTIERINQKGIVCFHRGTLRVAVIPTCASMNNRSQLCEACRKST